MWQAYFLYRRVASSGGTGLRIVHSRGRVRPGFGIAARICKNVQLIRRNLSEGTTRVASLRNENECAK